MAYNLRPRPGITVETLGPVTREDSRDPAAKEKDQGWRDSRVLGLLIAYRWLNVALVQTSFVPDEYWQSLEVAHNMVFGYGYMTWEWQTGLRGYMYPAMFALLFKILTLLNLDFPLVLIFAPRVLQATLSAIGDFCLYKTSCTLHGHSAGKWTLLMNTTSWFVFYNATRTLTNTMETTLTSIGLYFFPWPKDWLHDVKDHPKRNPRLYILIVALACIVRPTAAVLWLPLCLWHVKLSRTVSWTHYTHIIFPFTNIGILMIDVLLAAMVFFLPTGICMFLIDVVLAAIVLFLPVGVLAVGLSLLIDGYFYGQFVFVQKNFLEFNLIHDLGAFYGSHPWHWYFTQGFPVIMATHIITFLLGAKMGYKKNRLLLFVVLWTISIYSFASHKEFRFIYPVVPLCMLFCGLYMGHVHCQGKSKIFILCLLLNIPACAYFSLIHQRGVLDVMGSVRGVAEHHDAGLQRSVMFLMPCHSTPYYSHVHSKLPMRFLECPPPLSKEDNTPNEASVFYNDPVTWLRKEYSDTASIPTHLIFFDVLKQEIQGFLSEHNFKEVANYFHTHLPEGKMGSRVLVYARMQEDLLPDR